MYEKAQVVEIDTGRMVMLTTEGIGGYASVFIPYDENLDTTIHIEDAQKVVLMHRSATTLEEALSEHLMRLQKNDITEHELSKAFAVLKIEENGPETQIFLDNEFTLIYDRLTQRNYIEHDGNRIELLSDPATGRLPEVIDFEALQKTLAQPPAAATTTHLTPEMVIQKQAEKLINDATRLGIVLRIDTKYNPTAPGKIEMIADARAARGFY